MDDSAGKKVSFEQDPSTIQDSVVTEDPTSTGKGAITVTTISGSGIKKCRINRFVRSTSWTFPCETYESKTETEMPIAMLDMPGR